MINPSIAFAANNQGLSLPIDPVIPAVIPLPDVQMLGDITVDGTNTEFTIAVPGMYRIAYFVNISPADEFASMLLINGTQYIPSMVDIGGDVNTNATEVLVTLAAGDTISLALIGASATLTLSEGSGAVLVVQQIGA